MLKRQPAATSLQITLYFIVRQFKTRYHTQLNVTLFAVIGSLMPIATFLSEQTSQSGVLFLSWYFPGKCCPVNLWGAGVLLGQPCFTGGGGFPVFQKSSNNSLLKPDRVQLISLTCLAINYQSIDQCNFSCSLKKSMIPLEASMRKLIWPKHLV